MSPPTTGRPGPRRSDVDSTRTLDAVACTSSTFCEAVDASGYAAKYTGSWASGDRYRRLALDRHHCLPLDRAVRGCGCLGLRDHLQRHQLVDGLRRRLDEDHQGARLARRRTLCVAIDSSGYALTYNGSTWASATDVDGADASTP